MSDYIHLIARCAVRPGKAEDLKKIIGNFVKLCRENEPGLLMYEYYFNESETELHILETYRDNEAILNHTGKPKNRMDALKKDLFEAIDATFLGFFGPVSEEVMAGYELMNPEAFQHQDGFTR